ncbi:uncharacterized protein BKA55DRAFT_625337 [Fusarium redolens]|uniref:Uncharacterized protein n=1 Tax=Fusarium redolens TaxID=48865 RepID=A0A9P9G2Q9_FUSRE|nr:uncharacterized protein BKA55DRAFT_625337 [Fusarium redolens]KAH7231363.1 hypothetical protein BKA55DRAFT_625337 [Fusarium redolens]
MDGTYANSTKANGSDSGPSISTMLGVIAAVVLAVVALMALGPCILNRRRQHPGAQVDIESREDAPNGTIGLQTLDSTSPTQNYKFPQASKSRSSLASHTSNSLELWYVLDFFFFHF